MSYNDLKDNHNPDLEDYDPDYILCPLCRIWQLKSGFYNNNLYELICSDCDYIEDEKSRKSEDY